VARSRHPKKDIEAAIQYAEDHGWRVLEGGSHVCGFLYCPERTRAGCRLHVFSTPRNPFAHARDLRRGVDACQHEAGDQPEDQP
jgi:hypothetical protein